MLTDAVTVKSNRGHVIVNVPEYTVAIKKILENAVAITNSTGVKGPRTVKSNQG